jgi:hypothetical protein
MYTCCLHDLVDFILILLKSTNKNRLYKYKSKTNEKCLEKYDNRRR